MKVSKVLKAFKVSKVFVNIVVMWIVLTRESVTAGVSGRIDKGTEKRLEMMWCQHGCHSCKEQEVYNAVRTTHCATETIDSFKTFTHLHSGIPPPLLLLKKKEKKKNTKKGEGEKRPFLLDF